MKKPTKVFCQACKIIVPIDELVNRSWDRRKTVNGKTEFFYVDNKCCPNCDSNAIIYRLN